MSNYNKDIYRMYEEEFNKVKKLNKDIRYLRLEIHSLKKDLKIEKNKTDKAVKAATKPYIEENNKLKIELANALNEIDRLKKEMENNDEDDDKKDYLIDKLNNQINKDSTNSSIPTSKESIQNNNRRRTNTYNHRVASCEKPGAQFNHEGKTLTKGIMNQKIQENNLEVREVKHYVSSEKYNSVIEKYKVGIEVNTYVEKHIFIPSNESNELLPKDFYSDVTYTDNLKVSFIIRKLLFFTI